MATVTKLYKLPDEYHTWVASELTNGDIIDVFGSLGNREAHSVTIESIGGASTVRFNVVSRVYKYLGPDHNSFVGLGQGLARRAPYPGSEVEDTTKDDVVIEADSSNTWALDEIAIRDIKIVSKSSGLKITVT